MPSLAGSNGGNGGSYSITIAPSYNAAFGFATIKDRLICECPASFSSTSLTTVDMVVHRGHFTTLHVENLSTGNPVASLDVTSLAVDTAVVGTLTCTSATIGTLSVTNPIASLNVTSLTSSTATVSSLGANAATLASCTVSGTLTSSNANITGTLTSVNSRFTSLTSNTLSVTGYSYLGHAVVQNVLYVTNGAFTSASVSAHLTTAYLTASISTLSHAVIGTGTWGSLTSNTLLDANVLQATTLSAGTATLTSASVTGTLTTANTHVTSNLLFKGAQVPVIQSGTVVISVSSGTNLTMDISLGTSISVGGGYPAMTVMNGDMQAAGAFRPLSGHLMNATGSTVSPYTQFRLVYNAGAAGPARVHWQVIYIP